MTGKLTLMHHYTIKIIIFACIGKKKEINGFENPKISYSIHNLIFTSTSKFNVGIFLRDAKAEIFQNSKYMWAQIILNTNRIHCHLTKLSTVRIILFITNWLSMFFLLWCICGRKMMTFQNNSGSNL